jgi:hypothetical protein
MSAKGQRELPGQLKVTVKGRNGSYAGGGLPIRATVVFDHPSAVGGQCGEWLFRQCRRPSRAEYRTAMAAS